MSKAFTPRRVAELEPEIRALAVRYLDAALDTGSFDMVGDVAGKLPMDVISQMIGVPEPTGPRSDAWPTSSCTATRASSTCPRKGWRRPSSWPGTSPTWWPTRRRGPARRPHLGALDAELDGDRLSDDEIIAFLFLIVVAGNETTTKLLANAWYWAWRFPDQKGQGPRRRRSRPRSGWRRRCATTPRRRCSCGSRPATSSSSAPSLPDGERVLLLVGSANRDPDVFDDPDRYDLDRDTSKLISFGGGRHFCLGAPLARLEGRVVLEELVARVADYDIDADGARRVHSINVRGFATPPHHRHGALSGAATSTDAVGQVRRPIPDAGRRSWPGRRRASARPRPRALAAAGHPVVLGPGGSSGARRSPARITRAGGEAYAERLDLAEPTRWSEFAEAAAQTRWAPSTSWSSSAGHAYPGQPWRPSPGAFAHTVAVNLLGAHRLVWPLAPAMAARHHGDLVFVSSDDRARAPRPHGRPTWRRSGGSKGSCGPCRSSSRAPGCAPPSSSPARPSPRWATDWEPEPPPRCSRSGCGCGVARHSHFLAPPAVAAAVLAAVTTPPGTHLPMIEVQPEAPVTRRPTPAQTGGTP